MAHTKDEKLAGVIQAQNTRWHRVIWRQLLVIWDTILCYPSTLVIPLVVLSLLIAGGVSVVFVTSNKSAYDSKNKAQEDAEAAATFILEVLKDLTQPTYSLALYIQANSIYYDSILDSFPLMAQQLLGQVLGYDDQSIWLGLGPMAMEVAVYPITRIANQSLGLNLINNSNIVASLALPVGQQYSLVGPKNLAGDLNAAIGLVITAPVFVPGVPPNFSFNFPASIPAKCPPSISQLCFRHDSSGVQNNLTGSSSYGSKFWGIVSGVILFEPFLNGNNGVLNSLREKGYSYQLIQRSFFLPPTPGLVDASTGQPATLLASNGVMVGDPASVLINVSGAAYFEPMTLFLTSSSGWDPLWRTKALIVVNILAFIISALLFVLLLYMRQHQRLLYSLLPRTVVGSIFQTLNMFETIAGDVSLKGRREFLNAGSPVERLMELLNQLMQGSTPGIAEVLSLRSAFMNGGTLIFQPQDLRSQLKRAHNLDDDVINSLLREVQGLSAAAEPPRLENAVANENIIIRAKNVPDLGGNMVQKVHAVPQLEVTPTQQDNGCTQQHEGIAGSVAWAVALFVSDFSREQAVLHDEQSSATSSRHGVVDAKVMLGMPTPAEPQQSVACQPKKGDDDLDNVGRGHSHETTTAVNRGNSPLGFATSLNVFPGSLFILDQVTAQCTEQNKDPIILSIESPATPAVVLKQANLLRYCQGDSAGVFSKHVSGSFGSSSPLKAALRVLAAVRRSSQRSESTARSGSFSAATVQPSEGSEQSKTEKILLFPVDPAVKLLEASYGSWAFDVFKLTEATQGHPLSSMLYFLVARCGLIRTLNLDPRVLARLCHTIEGGYQPNPYHNREHATDVLQALHTILVNTGMMATSEDGGVLEKGYGGPLVMLACLLAAASHDLGHKGVTNDFLINNDDELALIYSDKAPMEHFHLALLFKLMKNPRFDLLNHLTKAERMRVRKFIIEMVSATDMKTHFSIFTQFSATHQVAEGDTAWKGQGSTDSVAAVSAPANSSSLPSSGTTPKPKGHLSPKDDVEQLISLQVALKCSDLMATARPWEVALKWSQALEQEFFEQGDRERELGLPISPLFDRNKPGVTKSQVGFYDFMVFPLFHNFACVFPGARPMVDMARSNYKCWKTMKISSRRLSLKEDEDV
ncbi:hypothetical protein CEUSTIGMA_g10437.t1 [Chlamydomonas eustigma]|uniref:Phosphodiesterase n=1 Tax=Chlamydomonas eustigma TaxID=1157962 RepID=A0A250XJM8_9CHLO|nr:hypothetical protein CEUSTIGMA_g10437.t1 [Chlamydomonas eustigma]|eukprot:GAX83010.1 hypothetical protein CEUSTIGMA_g10437.t1 [Chlamydomonas eustigma]